MSPRVVVFHHHSTNPQVLPIALSNSPLGWSFTEPDGDASSFNCLFMLLAQRPCQPVAINTGGTVPDPKQMASNEIEHERYESPRREESHRSSAELRQE